MSVLNNLSKSSSTTFLLRHIRFFSYNIPQNPFTPNPQDLDQTHNFQQPDVPLSSLLEDLCTASDTEDVDWSKFFLDSVHLIKCISRLCRSGNSGEAWDFFWRLVSLGCSVKTDLYNALFMGLERAKDFDRMNQLRMKMNELSIRPDVITFVMLIKYMCKSGRIDEALEMFGRMSDCDEIDSVVVKPNVAVCNALIDGLCKIGRREERGLKLVKALEIFNKMKHLGLKPNAITYNILIDGYCKSVKVDKALEIFRKQG